MRIKEEEEEEREEANIENNCCLNVSFDFLPFIL